MENHLYAYIALEQATVLLSSEEPTVTEQEAIIKGDLVVINLQTKCVWDGEWVAPRIVDGTQERLECLADLGLDLDVPETWDDGHGYEDEFNSEDIPGTGDDE